MEDFGCFCKGGYMERTVIAVSVRVSFLGVPEIWSHKELAGEMVVVQRGI